VSHEETQILLSAYLDGETSPEETTVVERHVAECEACQAELEALRETVGVLSRLDALDAPADFVDQVQGTIRRRSSGRYYPEAPERGGTRPPYDVVAVAMLAVLASVAVALLPAPPPAIPRIAGLPGAQQADARPEQAAYRVVAAGIDPAVVRKLAHEGGATAVREVGDGRLEIDLPKGTAQRLVDRLNEVSPLEVERARPPERGDRVVVRY